ncbi:MAG TPA: hypothetical protein VFV34_07120 [Blastocatellia bacterium]|nr:hypothetical protein [Blastocatellia bacterium]
MLRRILTCLFAGLFVSFAGCKKDAEIGSVLKELDSFTAELVQKIDSTQGAVEGIDAAQLFLDSKKGDLKKRLEVIKGARGFQVTEETKKKMTESFTRNITAVASLQLKYVSRSARDPRYKSKMDKLVGDYRDMLTG